MRYFVSNNTMTFMQIRSWKRYISGPKDGNTSVWPSWNNFVFLYRGHVMPSFYGLYRSECFCVGHYSPNFTQVTVHHTILHSCVNPVILATMPLGKKKKKKKKKLFGCPPLPAPNFWKLEKSFHCTKVYRP